MDLANANYLRAGAAWTIAAATLFVFSIEVSATTLARMSVNEMAQRAAVVVQARCDANQTSWDAGEIWTFTTFTVEETRKGTAAGNLRVRLLGGRAGDITSTVAGVPRFRAGEEVVLFLEKTGRGDYSVVGWIEGTFRIRIDRRSGQKIVTQDTAGFEVYDPAKREFRPAGIRDGRLADFKADVEAATGSAQRNSR